MDGEPLDPVEVFTEAAVEWAAGGRGLPLVEAAGDLLVAGPDTPSLRLLAGVPIAAAEDETGDLAPAVFEELGIDVPSRLSSEAFVAWARIRAHQFLEGAGIPREFTAEIARHYVASGYDSDLAELASLEHEYDLIELGYTSSSRSEVDEMVVWAALVLVGAMRPDARIELTSGDRNILIDGLSDDVAFVWVLIHLGLRGNPPDSTASPSGGDVQKALTAMERLSAAGLVRVGRTEYLDGGPPGRVAPVRHVEEPMDIVATRVRKACNEGVDWEWSCWLVNTPAGNAIARGSTYVEPPTTPAPSPQRGRRPAQTGALRSLGAVVVGTAVWWATMASAPRYSYGTDQDMGNGGALLVLLAAAAAAFGWLASGNRAWTAGVLVGLPGVVLSPFTAPRGDNDGLWLLIVPFMLAFTAVLAAIAEGAGRLSRS